jgi:hypothetical protein
LTSFRTIDISNHHDEGSAAEGFHTTTGPVASA